MRLLSFALTLLLMTLPSWAQSTSGIQDFVSAEVEVFSHEKAMNDSGLALEEWLAGRQSRQKFLDVLKRSEASLKKYQKLPQKLGDVVTSSERGTIDAMRSFAQAEAPDADGQKALFRKLGGFHEIRSTELLRWRSTKGAALKSKAPYLAWEANWLPIWLEEATLTRKLQLALLDSEQGKDGESRAILKSLLKLQAQAANMNVSPDFESVQQLSQERLTVLARTAEQLLRMEKRKSRGAITRVRRLSRKLTRLTQEFQEKRLGLLKML